jgi:hypothetical protein
MQNFYVSLGSNKENFEQYAKFFLSLGSKKENLDQYVKPDRFVVTRTARCRVV